MPKKANLYPGRMKLLTGPVAVLLVLTACSGSVAATQMQCSNCQAQHERKHKTVHRSRLLPESHAILAKCGTCGRFSFTAFSIERCSLDAMRQASFGFFLSTV